MGLLVPLALLGGLLAIPVVLLYMLRLRRREVVVSSNFLWGQVIRDHEANTPWQRLRRNLLLLLQLLLLACIVLALARPFQTVPALGGGRVALLIDTSASMNARDGADGGTRLDDAKAAARAIVEARAPGDQFTIVRAADPPEVLIGLSDDPARLNAAIDLLRPGSRAADWDAALTLAAAGAGEAERFSAVLISDGGGVLRDGATLPPIPGDLRYVPVGTSAENVGITALAIAALPGGAPELFAQIENFGTQTAQIIVDLRADDVVIDARRYALPSGETLDLTTDALPEQFDVLRLGITPASDASVPDHLAADDQAWAAWEGRAARRVLIVAGEQNNLFLESGFNSLPRVDVRTARIARPVSGGYDLIVYDGVLPFTLPPEGALWFINPPRETTLFAVGAPAPVDGVIRVARDDPRMTYTDFSGVNILAFRPAIARWAQPLISTPAGALLLAGETDEPNPRRAAILTFDVRDSDLPLSIQFPILLASLTDWLVPDRAPQLPAEALNLFDRAESRIAPARSIQLGTTSIAPAEADQSGQREGWTIAALAAIALALIEWTLFHRRARAPFRPSPPRPVSAR